jgi:ADP-ribose pyrophosphatase
MPDAPRVLRRTIVYDGRIFRVERDTVVLPAGRRAAIEVVRHRGSVVLVAQPSPGEVIIVRQYRHAIRRWIWELPAGSLEARERPATAARRECEEEIGLTPRRVRAMGTLYPTPGFCDERMVFYRCTDLRPPKRRAAPDVDEQIEPRTVSIADAWRMAARGEIIDMKTIVGLVLTEQGRSRRAAPGARRLRNRRRGR